MDKKSVVIVGGTVVMIVAVLAGLYWNRQTVPVNDAVPGTIAITGVSLVTAILFGAVARLRATLIALIVGSALAAGALLDATIHFFVPPETANLFPFVVIALGVMGALAGLVGGLLGQGIVRLLGSAESSGGR
ncbi:hypothetical protein [Pseudomonas sp. N040]|uniref:hypothetical protein n=1 Tax=Pseudomonas sp. N040 TaxID=2785325 RepID=UPI0018A2934B|nr:hypothetical protein [Pseudomonas sp. N040]MBF7731094.1 hypothetical protein [Pseudomonas sp. N040]MBW7014737.1 hypothetical protein [Pseudomonas sp. N040]